MEFTLNHKYNRALPSIMDALYVGESAALFTSFCWTLNSIFFASAGKRIGSVSVNAIRIVTAVIFLTVTHVILFGTLVPMANQSQWMWMGISGIVGLGLGDFALFTAFVVIGPRRSLLLMALAPVATTAVGFLMLGEVLGPWSMLGVGVTLSGVLIVLLEKKPTTGYKGLTPRQYTVGTILGITGAIGQGTGLALSKYGMVMVADDPTVPLNPLSATLIRMIVGAVFIWISVSAMGKLPEVFRSVKDPRAMKFTASGAFIGPFLGVTSSMIAVLYTQAGIAATLMSLMPVMIIPVVWFLYKERTNWRGIMGAVVAVIGVAILFLH